MSDIQLSTRLKTVANLVPINSVLADIGSDHAYLPVYLIQHSRIKRAIAGEVVQGPFESAQITVQEHRLTHQIDVRFGDGLEVVELSDSVSAITICGMGGELIASILEKGLQSNRLSGEERLILQPNVAEHLVRKWLMDNQYRIVEELIVEDNQRIYEIIVAEKSNESIVYSHQELQHGVFLTTHKPLLAIKKWRQLLQKNEYILEQLKMSSTNQTDKIQYVQTEIALLKELIE